MIDINIFENELKKGLIKDNLNNYFLLKSIENKENNNNTNNIKIIITTNFINKYNILDKNIKDILKYELLQFENVSIYFNQIIFNLNDNFILDYQFINLIIDSLKNIKNILLIYNHYINNYNIDFNTIYLCLFYDNNLNKYINNYDYLIINKNENYIFNFNKFLSLIKK